MSMSAANLFPASPWFARAKVDIKKSIPLQCNGMPMFCQRFANVLLNHLFH